MNLTDLVVLRQNNEIPRYVLEVSRVLERFWKKYPEIRLGNKKLADLSGYAVSTVKRALKRLKDLGYLERICDYSLRTRRHIVRAGRALVGMLPFMALSGATEYPHETPESIPTTPSRLPIRELKREFEEEEIKETEKHTNSRACETHSSAPPIKQPPTPPKPAPPIDPELLAVAISADERFPLRNLDKQILAERPALDADVMAAALDDLAKCDPCKWRWPFLRKGIYQGKLEQKLAGLPFRPAKKYFTREEYAKGFTPELMAELKELEDELDAHPEQSPYHVAAMFKLRREAAMPSPEPSPLTDDQVELAFLEEELDKGVRPYDARRRAKERLAELLISEQKDQQ